MCLPLPENRFGFPGAFSYADENSCSAADNKYEPCVGRLLCRRVKRCVRQHPAARVLRPERNCVDGLKSVSVSNETRRRAVLTIKKTDRAKPDQSVFPLSKFYVLTGCCVPKQIPAVWGTTEKSVVKQNRKFCEAFFANALFLVYYKLIGRIAENARRRKLFENYAVSVGEHFNCIVFRSQTEQAANFHRNYEASVFVKFSYDTCCFHFLPPRTHPHCTKYFRKSQ